MEPVNETCSALAIDSKVVQQGASKSHEFGTLLYPVLLNFLQLVAAVTFLVCIVRHHRAKDIFVPRRQPGHRRGDPIDWFRTAYQVNIQEAITIDGRVVVRLCRLGLTFTAAGSVIGAGLAFMYYTQGSQTGHGPMRCSISNLLTAEPPVVWCVVAASYMYVAFFVWLMRAEWRYFIAMRQQHFAMRARGELGAEAQQAQCSLMIEGIPKKYTSSKMLQAFFNRLFDGRIHSCILQRDTLMLYHLKVLEDTQKTVSCFCRCCQASVEAQMKRIVRLEAEIIQRARQTESTFTGFALDGRITTEELAGLFRSQTGPAANAANGDAGDSPSTVAEPGAGLAAASTGFVTLLRAGERAVSEQVILFNVAEQLGSSNSWNILPAPEERALIWENVAVPHAQVRKKRRIGDLLCLVGVLLWGTPVAGIQAIFSEAGLEKWAKPAVDFVARHKALDPGYRILTGYLPVLALLALLLLLPYVLWLLAVRFETRKTKTDVAQIVLFRNFMFQIFSLWLTVFSSSIMNSFQQILHRPSCAATILGSSIPKVSIYFTQFVIARIGISLPLLLIRTDAIFALFSRAKPEPVYCTFQSEMTNIAIVFVIGSMYCVVQPLIMPACFIYFALAFGIYKWLFVHVYESEFDCGGELWYPIFNGLVGGMVFGMLSVVGLVMVYTGSDSWQCRAMWVLPLLLIGFATDCNRRLAPMSRVLPYQDAVEIDSGEGIDTSSFESDFYLDPMLSGKDRKDKQRNGPDDAGFGDPSSSEESSTESEDDSADEDGAGSRADDSGHAEEGRAGDEGKE